MGIKHTYQSATPNNAGKEVSSSRWNEDHQIDGPILFPDSSDPSTPSADTAYLYFKDISNRMVPKVKGPSGLDYPLQASFWGNNIIIWQPTTATAGLWIGTAGSTSGTYSTSLRAGNSPSLGMKRARWANVATTLNQALGLRSTENAFYRGNQPRQGGFFYFSRCGFDVWTDGSRFFAGFGAQATTEVTASDLISAGNSIGFCVESGDNGGISFVTVNASNAKYKQSTGFTITSGKMYDLYIFCPPNSDVIYWRIKDIDSDTDATGSLSNTEAVSAGSGLPGAIALMAPKVLASNGSLTAATSTQLSVNRVYVESDY